MGNGSSKVVHGDSSFSSSSQRIDPRPRRRWLEFLKFLKNWGMKKAGGGIRRLRFPLLWPPPVKVRPGVDSPAPDLSNSSGPQERLGGDEDPPLRHDSNSSSSTSVEDEGSDDQNDVGNASEPDHIVSPVGSFRQGITSWKKGELLGRGSSGAVYEAIADNGSFFAVKEASLLDQEGQGKQSLLQLEQEISLLSQFDHENIVRYLGTDKCTMQLFLLAPLPHEAVVNDYNLDYVVQGNQQKKTSDDKNLYVFLELMTKGSLATLYRKYKLKDSQVSAFTRQILNGLKYLHDKKVAHRDIKCANILVDASGSVKLADFGLAKATEMNSAKTFIGSPFWMAPEVVNPKKRSSRSNGSYGLEADIWSLGCTVLEMLTGQRPYPKLDREQAWYKIGKGIRPRVPQSLSNNAQGFILTCLRKNPKRRPSVVQLLDHPFVREPPATSGFASPLFNN